MYTVNCTNAAINKAQKIHFTSFLETNVLTWFITKTIGDGRRLHRRAPSAEAFNNGDLLAQLHRLDTQHVIQ